MLSQDGDDQHEEQRRDQRHAALLVVPATRAHAAVERRLHEM
jgi:hypothetical protein